MVSISKNRSVRIICKGIAYFWYLWRRSTIINCSLRFYCAWSSVTLSNFFSNSIRSLRSSSSMGASHQPLLSFSFLLPFNRWLVSFFSSNWRCISSYFLASSSILILRRASTRWQVLSMLDGSSIKRSITDSTELRMAKRERLTWWWKYYHCKYFCPR